MSVIAKFVIRNTTQFGTGQLVELGCWCDNDLMTTYATSEQDKLFTKYSPWGEIRLNTPEHMIFGSAPEDMKPASAFYVMALNVSELDPIDDIDTKAFPGAAMFFKATCKSLTDLGAGTKNVEFRLHSAQPHRGALGFNWKMAVDNPGASDQFKPLEHYWIVFYRADKFDRDAAIAAAHHQEKPLAAT